MATDAHSRLFPTPAERPWPRVVAGLRADAVIASALFLVFATLYWFTRTQYNTFDAVSYANQIGRLYVTTHDPHWLFHPHHLLFNVTNYLVWRASQALGYVGGPLVTMERVNSLLAAGGISVFYLSLRRLIVHSHGLPALMAAGMALSLGYWICATDGRVNMPQLFFLLLAFYFLCRIPPSRVITAAVPVGMTAGVAALYHESAVLFVVVGLAGVLLAASDSWTRLRAGLAYGAAWTVTLVVPYLLVATCALHLHSWHAFRQWTTEYAELGWWWSFNIPHNLRLDLYAFRHAAFAEPPGKSGTFFLAKGSSLGVNILYFTALSGWLIAVYAFCAALPLLWRSHHRPIVIVCLLWILVYAAFFTVWCPGYFVFWVPVLAPTGLLLALGMCLYRSGRRGLWVNTLLAVWIALFTCVNWANSMGPHLRPGANAFVRIAANVKAHTQTGDVVLLAGAGEEGQCEVFIPYFANRDVISLHTLLTRAHNDKTVAYAQAQTEMQTAWASGHNVYALDELWHGTQAWHALLKKHPGVQASDLDGWAVRAPVSAWTDIHGRPVWRLVPPPPKIAAPLLGDEP
jgi:hypothetical protein